MIIETMGRVFHMHVQVMTEDGPDEIIADVVIEPATGLLMVTAGGVAASTQWPYPDRWGTETFEEFLCQRTPSWITGQLLGDDAMIFDPKRTAEALLSVVGDKMHHEISEFIRHIDECGDVRETGEEVAQKIQDELDEPIDGWVMMQPTGFAQFLIQGVLPSLQERIAPPPVVVNQTHLKLC